MNRRLTLLVTLVTLSCALHGTSLSAAPRVPKKVQVVDPAGDANFVTFTDYPTPVDASAVGDLLKVWFTNDKTTISAHIQIEAAPPDGLSHMFRVWTNPDDGYLTFGLIIPGANRTGSEEPFFYDTNGQRRDASAEVVALPDGSGLVTITVSRVYSPLFATGGRLVQPYADSGQGTGHQFGPEEGGPVIPYPFFDATREGSDYVVKKG